MKYAAHYCESELFTQPWSTVPNSDSLTIMLIINKLTVYAKIEIDRRASEIQCIYKPMSDDATIGG